MTKRNSDLREDIKELLDILKSKNKIKNTIKCTMFNNLIYLERYIQHGPGIVSPAKVEEKLDSTIELSTIWIKDSEFNSLLNSVSERIKNNNLVEEKVALDNEENAVIIEEPPSIPRYIERLRPKEIVKLDVAYLPIGPVNHYCLVYKVIGEVSFVIPFTTSGVDQFVGYDITKSRFWKGKAVYTLHQFPTSMVLSKFVMPYDHKTEAMLIIKNCESYIRGLLPKERKRKK